MNGQPIKTREDLLAHAHALTCESQEQLDMLAASLRAHNNPGAAAVFQTLSQAIGQRIQEIESMAAGLVLPQIPPWDYRWRCTDDPSVQCMAAAHYLMSERQALELALFNEQRTQLFFQDIAATATDDEIYALAQQLYEGEHRFVEDIMLRLQKLGDSAVPHQEDLDPPNAPE